jgi:hypothetical protein
MKNLKEIEIGNILKNVAGDKVRAAISSLPGIGTAAGVGSIILNYSELNDDLERFTELKKDFEDGKGDNRNMYEEFEVIEEELKTDFIDMLQAAGEIAIPGFKIFNIIGLPLLTSLSIESILDEVSNILPFDENVENSMVPYLAAIKDISRIKKELKDVKPVVDNPNEFMDNILEPVTEGKKKTGTKLCSRGISAAKSKFDVWPSAYSSGYAVQVCKGKIKGLDGKKQCSGKYCKKK